MVTFWTVTILCWPWATILSFCPNTLGNIFDCWFSTHEITVFQWSINLNKLLKSTTDFNQFYNMVEESQILIMHLLLIIFLRFKRHTSLFRALAIDLAMLVLPTPGGPWKHSIFPCVEPFSLLTAINSCKHSHKTYHCKPADLIAQNFIKNNYSMSDKVSSWHSS